MIPCRKTNVKKFNIDLLSWFLVRYSCTGTCSLSSSFLVYEKRDKHGGKLINKGHRVMIRFLHFLLRGQFSYAFNSTLQYFYCPKSLEKDLSENINIKRHSIALYLAENWRTIFSWGSRAFRIYNAKRKRREISNLWNDRRNLCRYKFIKKLLLQHILSIYLQKTSTF